MSLAINGQPCYNIDYKSKQQNNLHLKTANNIKNYKNLKLNDFSEFKTELSELQTNIDKLEKKLCKYNS